MIKIQFNLRNIFSLILLFWVVIVTAQKPQDIQLLPSSTVPRACPDRHAGSVRLGSFRGQSNDVTLARTYLCIGDELNFVHNGDGDVTDSDPDPLTAPGIGYIWYTCTPTVERATLMDIQGDPCLLTNPTPSEGAWLYVDNLNGDALFQNSNQISGQSIPDFFNMGEPIEFWFAPFTVDAVINGQPVLEGSPTGPCVHSNINAAFSIVYLTPISFSHRQILPDGNGGCVGSFSLFGGLPQFDGSSYTITSELEIDPTVTGTFLSNNYTHGDEVQFSFPQDGRYTITIEDGKSCAVSFSMEVGCTNSTNPVVYNIGSATTAINDVVTIPVNLDAYNSVGANSFELRWNPQIIEYVSNSGFQIPADGIATINDLFADEGRLIVLYVTNDFLNGTTVTDGTTFLDVDFRAVGDCGAISDITISDMILVDNAQSPLLYEVNPGEVNINLGSFDSNVNTCADDGSGNGSIFIQLCGGNSPYQINYLGPNNGFDNVTDQNGSSLITGLNAGVFNITITDDNGLMQSFQVTVPVGAVHDVNININPPTCHYSSDGTARVDISPPGAYDIAWSTDVYQVDSITNLSNGQYRVTVTNDMGCDVIHNFTVLASPLSLDFSTINPTCITSENGRIRVRASGGTSFGGEYIYQWLGMARDTAVADSLLNLGIGSHSITVYDANGCSITETFTLTSDKKIVLDNPPEIDHIECFGEAEGSIGLAVSTINATNDMGYAFEWEYNGAANLQFISALDSTFNSSGLTGGTYFVTITDFDEGMSCTLDTFFTIEEAEPIQVEIVSVVPASCSDDDGELAIRVSGGNTSNPDNSFLIQWDDHLFSQSLSPGQTRTWTGVPADTLFYTVFQTDGGTLIGCSIDSFIVFPDEEGPEILSYDSVSVSCGGGNDGELRIFFNPANMGTVTWTDNNGNTYNGDHITGLASGYYYVRVTTTPGCESIDTIILAAGTDIVLDQVVYNTPTCPNSGNGSITVLATGPGNNLDYAWNHPNGSDNPTLPGVESGMYSVTISTPGGGCPPLIIDTLYLRPPEVFDVTFSNVNGATCAGICNGTATANVTGGSGSYTFNWGNTEITNSASMLCAELQILEISDGICIDTFHLNIPAADSISLMSTIITPSCAGDSDGSINLVPSGMNPPFTISWDDSGMGFSRTNLMEGTYLSTIMDQQGCLRTDTFRLTVPDALNLSIQPQNFNNITCAGRDDGQVILTVIGGNGNNVFSWIPNVSSSDVAQNLAPNTYTVTVMDNRGCTDDTTFIISEPPAIIYELGEQSDIACFGEQATFTVDTVYGGSGGPYQFSINNGALNDIGQQINIFGGNYVLNVFDGSGCNVEESISIVQPPEFSVNIGEDITVSLGDSAQLGINSFIGGFPITEYSWISTPTDYIHCDTCSEPWIFPFETSDVQLLITDSTGCTTSDVMTVFVDATRKVYIPNAFSPNFDGINDVFQVYTGQGVDFVASIQVFNRWGGQVFNQSYEDNNRAEITGWDGTNNGRFVDPGVYVYVVQVAFFDGRMITYRGDLTLVR